MHRMSLLVAIAAATVAMSAVTLAEVQELPNIPAIENGAWQEKFWVHPDGANSDSSITSAAVRRTPVVTPMAAMGLSQLRSVLHDVHDAAREGDSDCGRAVAHFQLHKQSLDVRLYRLLCNAELVRDLFVAHAIGDEFQYLQLTW